MIELLRRIYDGYYNLLFMSAADQPLVACQFRFRLQASDGAKHEQKKVEVVRNDAVQVLCALALHGACMTSILLSNLRKSS